MSEMTLMQVRNALYSWPARTVDNLRQHESAEMVKAIDAHIAQHAETERQRDFWKNHCDEAHDNWQAEIDKHAEMVAKLRELVKEWEGWTSEQTQFDAGYNAALTVCGGEIMALLDAQPAVDHAMTGKSP